MESVPPTTPCGHTVFCDDIRHELNGKLTLVGTYNAAMYIAAEFPVTLTKLCLLVTYMERFGEQNGDLTLRVHFPGEAEDSPIIFSEVPIGNMRNGDEAPLGEGQFEFPEVKDRLHVARLPLEISPCVIREPGPIRVRMQCGDKIYKLGALLVLPAPAEIMDANQG